MKRRIIEIDQDKCNGCGACAAACHEGAIAMVDGKAKLMRDDYCDGLGDCLPTCPTGAIRFVEREAAAYDEQAVLANKQKKMQKEGAALHHGCPGMQLRTFAHKATQETAAPAAQESQLSQWPVQIRLVPVNAPYFSGAKLLIAADCTAYAYAAFHEKFIKGHITLPEARQRGLQRKARRDHRGKRYQKRDGRAHGGPVLRRTRARGEDRAAKKRQVHPLAGGDDLDGRQNIG